MPANEMLKVIREKSELLEIDRKFLSRSLNEGFQVERRNVMKFSKWLC
jgi:Fe-S cluster assembly ATPase SufC